MPDHGGVDVLVAVQRREAVREYEDHRAHVLFGNQARGAQCRHGPGYVCWETVAARRWRWECTGTSTRTGMRPATRLYFTNTKPRNKAGTPSRRGLLPVYRAHFEPHAQPPAHCAKDCGKAVQVRRCQAARQLAPGEAARSNESRAGLHARGHRGEFASPAETSGDESEWIDGPGEVRAVSEKRMRSTPVRGQIQQLPAFHHVIAPHRRH